MNVMNMEDLLQNKKLEKNKTRWESKLFPPQIELCRPYKVLA